MGDYNTPFDFQASTCSREIFDVRFMYFSPEEIRATSVHQIHSVLTYDEFGEATRGGLHAPLLGPSGNLRDIAKKDGGQRKLKLCETCGCQSDCPGHMGHIELATTVYNPLLFNQLYKLLKAMCLECHHLKAPGLRTAETVRIIKSLLPGRFAAADEKTGKDAQNQKRSAWLAECDGDATAGPIRWLEFSEENGTQQWVATEKPATSAKNAEFSEKLVAKFAAGREEKQQQATQEPAGDGFPQDSACMQSIRGLLDEYVREFPLTKCHNCKTKPGKCVKDGYKGFQIRREGKKSPEVVTAAMLKKELELLWKNEREILNWLIPGAREIGPDVFFLEAILVPPVNFRPPSMPSSEGNMPRFSRQSTQLLAILEANEKVEEENNALAGGKEAGARGKLLYATQQLQLAVNQYMDGTKTEKHAKNRTDGVRQLLERKSGLFRMKMMGKRVNFAARSVISPDPNIETSEIGIPKFVARRLTYPEVAAKQNAKLLRSLVERGPEYPGATEVHVPGRAGNKNVLALGKMPEDKRKALAKQLVTDIESGNPPMTVFRQLQDGDPLLVNRQPTLHKPGIMAHVARVLEKEATVRLHYVNCNTYNADFDGDEMNLHAPQDPIGRIEALEIAQADRQYLVPTSGKPLRGLIQDHVIAGAMLTKRDTFFDRATVCELLYGGLRAAAEKGRLDLWGGHWRVGKVSIARQIQRVALQLDPPTLFKPRRLWTGKQVFSMLVKNLTRIYGADARNRAKGKPSSAAGLYMESKSKTPGDLWNGILDGDKEEANILFQDAELLRGVLDKSQFGASSFGITHLLFELFGPHLVGIFLAALARLLTLYLQIRGFTCAFADLVLREDAEQHRHQLLRNSRSVAKSVGEKWLESYGRDEGAEGGVDMALHRMMCRLSEQPEYSQEASVAGTLRSQSRYAHGLLDRSLASQVYEGMMIGSMKESWTDMIGRCIPAGQQLPFPRNCFAAMVQTGAKGSKINHSQVCCCLGQQELEGRLPPLMATMRSLPCFAPYDLSSRTRGYITDRFLTGIRPQEFFFHCMAGREGLVDTAVKTSRSGYLQRCLVKHLESLKVSYDLSVRDNDGAVVQFLYGEDGTDVMRSPYLLQFAELHRNFHFVQSASRRQLEQLRSRQMEVDMDAAGMYGEAQQKARDGKFKAAGKQLRDLLAACPDLEPAAVEYIQAARGKLRKEVEGMKRYGVAHRPTVALDPTASVLNPARYFGSTSEAHEEALRKFVDEAKAAGRMSPEEVEEFRQCMQLKFLRGLAEPGEAVGVVAAQSMGEPSTQMTLNTFHLAGHGGANVTLGIPRLREIIQTASKSCATPLMRVPVIANDKGQTDYQARLKYAKRIQQRFRSLKLQDAVNRLIVHEGARLIDGNVVYYYEFMFEFIPAERMMERRPNLTTEKIEAIMKGLSRKLQSYIKKIKDAQARFKDEAETGETDGAAVGEEDADEGEGRQAAEEGGERDGLALAEEDGSAKKRKKPRKILGAEDKFAAEDEADAEEDAGGDGEGSEISGGMYSSEEDEKSGDAEEDVQQAGAGEGDLDQPLNGGVGEPPRKKARTHEQGNRKEDDEDDEVEDESEMGEDDDSRDDEIATLPAPGNTEADASGKAPDMKKSGAAVTEKEQKKAAPKAKARAGKEAPGKGDSKFLDEILASGEIVWRSKLENNRMVIFVHYNQLQIPHRIFIKEEVVKLVKSTDLQDPSTDGVKCVHVREEPAEGKVMIECEGINLFGFQCQQESTLDMRRIYTNDMTKILKMYGVEAARASVVREVQEVFGHYGIVVDTRHLSLIADYMTQAGELRAFNRMGMTHNASPLLQMSFETATTFLVATCKDAVVDRMSSPASALVVGKTPPVGTGTVSLLTDLQPPEPQWKRRREIKLSG